jgi:diguanylate cyclase (GGDEF)-like protein
MALMPQTLARWLRRQPAARRLRWAFGLQLLLLLLVAGFAALRFHSHQQMVQDLASGSLQRIRLAAEISGNTDRSSRLLLALLTGDREARDGTYRLMEDAHRRIDVAVTELREMHDQSRRLAPLATALALYRGTFDEAVALVEAGDEASTYAHMAQRTEPALARLGELTEILMDSEQAAAQALVEAHSAQVRRDLLGLALLCVVALVAGVLVTRAIRRSITVPLQRTELVALRLAQGDYSARAAVRGRDEVAGVATALNALAVAIADREAEIRRLGDTDVLTGLPQRSRFLREVDAALAAHPAQPFVLVCLDLERLKTINALVGFEAGDAALVACAERVQALAWAHAGAVARLGGGSFGLLVPFAADLAPEALPGLALARAAALRHSLESPLSWAGQAVDLSLTLGLALYPAQADRAEVLLRRAEHAMFDAKRRKSGPLLYDPAMAQARTADLSLAGALQQAQALGQLRAYLQPKLGWVDGRLRCVGAEALIRWQHPERGFVPPSEFIPFAERTGRVRALTDWMLGQAVSLLAQPALAALQISVNLSTHDLQDDDLDQRLRSLLSQNSLNPARLTLEITESGLMEQGGDPVGMLHRLKAVGVRLAIDDFGTGHSSLAYLQQLPVDELKIDRSFVRDVDLDPRRDALLTTIVQLGHNLGLTVTAEGVEREAELAAVQRAGCDLVQGYLTGRPMASEALADWLAQAGAAVPPAPAE